MSCQSRGVSISSSWGFCVRVLDDGKESSSLAVLLHYSASIWVLQLFSFMAMMGEIFIAACVRISKAQLFSCVSKYHA